MRKLFIQLPIFSVGLLFTSCLTQQKAELNSSRNPSNSNAAASLTQQREIEIPSGLKGEIPFAISSALTNSLQFKISGRILNEAVVLPAPLQPATM